MGRSIGELKRIFEGVNANEQGHANKAELAASLEKERNLDALLKEAGMKEVMETVVHEVEHKIEQLKQEVQQGAEKLQHEVEHAAAELKKEAQHEAEEFKKEVAADVAAGRQALTWLKGCFESLTADDEGAVSKEELANKLKESEDAEGHSISDLVGQAGFNPSWTAF